MVCGKQIHHYWFSMCVGEIIIQVFGDISPPEVSRRGSCVILFGVFLPWGNEVTASQ